MKPNMEPKAVCILGMHRSGTSAITRAVNLLGAYLGEEADLVLPSHDNPLGYWEREDIINIHDSILNYYKRPWDALMPLPRDWYLSDEAGPFKKDLFGLIKKNFSGKKLWAWKDPRTCLTLELWKEVLRELDIELVTIFVVRNPLDVARSLEKRDGFSKDKAFGIWFNYSMAALKATNGLKRFFISYDRFLEDWESELKRCAEGLEIPWSGADAQVKKEIRSFVRPDLRHSASTADDLKRVDAPHPAFELYRLLERAMGSSSTPDSAIILQKKVEKLFEDFSSYALFFREDMEGLFQGIKQDLLETKKTLVIKDAQIEEFLNSWSWRITAPFRGIFNLFRHKSSRQ